MKIKIVAIFVLSILAMKVGIGQVIPTGVTLKVNGKLEITLDNYRHNIDPITDSVLVTCNSYKRWMDVLELESEYLSVIETPDPDWTNWSVIGYEHNPDDEYLISVPIATYALYDSTLASNQKVPKINVFEDVFEYHGELTEAQKEEIHTKLNTYAFQHSEKPLVMADWYKLQKFLSVEDTIINKEPVYDYLIDKVVFYEYDSGKLVGSIGYFHANSGIEIDTLKYDSKGNLIFFSKESIGISHDSYYFYYNVNNQVVEVKHVYYHYESDQYEKCPSCKKYSTYNHEFSYNAEGKLSSKKHLSGDKWYECTFDYLE